MNKKITHEQVERVFGKIVWLTNRLANWNGDDLEYLEKEYNYLTNSQVVWNFLKQQEKREKLLELYRELNNKILHTYDIFERMTNKEWKKFADIQQQIKELENE